MTTVSAVGRPEALQSIEDEMWVVIRRVKRVIGERARAVHPELQRASYVVLTWLAEHGPVRASAVAEAFEVDKGSLSRQLQHLQELGLVDREPDPEDGRAALLSISEEAVRRLAAVAAERRVLLDRRLADWTAEELLSLAAQLRRYNDSLGS
ncbi:MarR family winged helix-turn-helix transcriptional regulator [Nocardioides sp.]|uniref:MarR family winged helix-turn-helix transcriptional regulator n=1 Tax=Nocardioides sp. TaxID=35761 RepID=UPI0039E46B7E